MNALVAYQRAATGAGIGIAVIDTGIDLQSEEFGNRLSTASADVGGNGTIDDVDGHGTAVAFTAAGRRNGTGTHGVAFDATVIALRSDRPGTCTGEPDANGDDTCRFDSDALARGIDTARTAGARVINLSLGSTSMPQSVQQALSRATQAGIVVILSAGNDGAADPDGFAAVADDASVSRNQVIIAGWVDHTDRIDDDANRAGSNPTHYLAAVGTRVAAPDQNGTVQLWSGSSFAAPQIAGAVALLAQAFPNLTGAQIVDLLLTTARDVGQTGTDSVYGRGVLDLTRAFQPVGTTSIAGTRLATSGTAALSAPMGDAAIAPMGAVILDGYGRAFAAELAQTIQRTGPLRPLGGTLLSSGRHVGFAAGATAVSLTLSPTRPGGVATERLNLSQRDAVTARALAGTVTQRLGRTLSFGIGLSQGSAGLSAQLAGSAEPAFMIASADGLGFEGGARSSTAVRQQWDAVGLTMAVENGRVLSRRDAYLPAIAGWQRSGFDRVSLGLDRAFGPVTARFTGSRLIEDATVLGARFDPSFGGASATSWFLDAGARLTAGAWTFGGTMRSGWTRASLHGGLGGGGLLRTSAYSADVGRTGLFGGDSIGLRIAQPLRVSAGGIDLALPTFYDYAGSAVTAWTPQRMTLAPSGREVDIEARYSRPFAGGDLQANLYWRRDPGNIAALPDDQGIALRYALVF
ncbi:hypothetical protein ASG07_04140 [Sphingomonas sp. Leaf343]|nr:hypothetical protein ASG07_04140 [Sphingomonas sp. Leaf343]